MTQTQNGPKMVKRVVAGVFVSYRTVQENYAGERVEVVASADRGQEIELPEQEAKRLDSLAMLAPEGYDGSDVEAAVEARKAAVAENIRRAIDPTAGLTGDLFPVGEITVSPPSLGVPPAGGLIVEGDTGMPDITRATPSQAAGPPRGPGDVTADNGPSAEGFDARGKSVTEVSEWLDKANPNGPQTIAAAHDDAEAAETLKEAEELHTSGDARKTVIEGLDRVIKADDESDE
jgi:hypothetical protein